MKELHVRVKANIDRKNELYDKQATKGMLRWCLSTRLGIVTYVQGELS